MRKIILLLFLLPFGLLGQNTVAPVIATFCGLTDGKIMRDEVSLNDSIVLYYNDCKYSNARVKSFTISPQGVDAEHNNVGNKLSEESLTAIWNTETGGIIWIENIKIIVDTTIIGVNSIRLKMDGLRACIFSNPDDRNYIIRSCSDSNNVRTVARDPLFGNATISKKNFLLNDYILIANPAKDFEDDKPVTVCYQIAEYNLTLYDKDNRQLAVFVEYEDNGDKISKKIKKAIRKNKNIGFIEIGMIRAVDLNGKIIKIGCLFLTII